GDGLCDRHLSGGGGRQGSNMYRPPQGGHQRSAQELRLDQATTVLLGASGSRLSGDGRSGRRVGRGRSAVVGTFRAAVRLVASAAGRDDGSGHPPEPCGDAAVLVPGRPAPGRGVLLRQDGRDVPGVAGGETHLWTFVRVEGIEPTNN